MSTQVAGAEAGAAVPRPPTTPRSSFWLRPSVGRGAIVATFAGLWELVSRLEFVNPVFLPAPTQILAAGVDIVDDPRVIAAFRVTGGEVLAGFLIAVTAGLTVGILLGLVPTLRDAYLGPILFLLSTPKSIFLPLFLLIFGLGTTAKVAFGAFSAFFYVVTNVVGGVGLLLDRHKRLARAFQAPLRHYLTDIVVPSALPGIFAGLWFGLRQTIVGVLIAELFASSAGIGFLIKVFTNQFRTDRTLAVVMMLSLLAILAGSMWTRIEHRLQRWRGEAHTT
jgi:ABC-type nitrate/sulfonate/bicarbonate transport system permease component